MFLTRFEFRIIFALIAAFVFLLAPMFSLADTEGQRVLFYIDPKFDELGRSQVWAKLVKITMQNYFYFEEDYWNSFDDGRKNQILNSLYDLGHEFENKIYPNLTAVFGSEWKPGIDNDLRITVLYHRMGQRAVGYYNSGDEFYKVQYPQSNEREMVYLNSSLIGNALEKSYLAHEFTHLITFYQKEKFFGVTEETWLSEVRAESASALLGYNEPYSGSNLQKRVSDFLNNPDDSLTEWQGKSGDYGVTNLFLHYLLDYYGSNILSETLKMQETGIASFNRFLREHHYSEDFSRVFTNWAIASYANNCLLGEKYCYKNQNLSSFQVIPNTDFLPLSGFSSLEMNKSIKNWAGNWEKIIGGSNNLKLEFFAPTGKKFIAPYFVSDSSGGLILDFLNFNQQGVAIIYMPDFRLKNVSLTLVPLLENSLTGIDGEEIPTNYTFRVSAINKEELPSEQEKLKLKLLEQIGLLKKQIAEAQTKLNALLMKQGGVACLSISANLLPGNGGEQVKCLQSFLKVQGAGIYPEGIVSGYYGQLTTEAVKRFQLKYASEILTSLGLTQPTGIVGERTRGKVNDMIGIIK